MATVVCTEDRSIQRIFTRARRAAPCILVFEDIDALVTDENRSFLLNELDGFVEFHMLRGPEKEDHVLYSSHTVWEDRASFEAWTRSEQFRKSHARAGNNER